jgi:hypothetical protein
MSPRSGAILARRFIKTAVDSDGGRRADLGNTGAILDPKARQAYRRRLAELAAAEQVGDGVRARDGQAPIDTFGAVLRTGGRHRRAASHAERPRVTAMRCDPLLIPRPRGCKAMEQL